MSDKLKACPCCGTSVEVQDDDYIMCNGCGLMISRCDAPEGRYIDAWNTRAQQSQGGEAVEVVAYLNKRHMRGLTFQDELEGSEPLMTVAQHQRILDASAGSAEPVAMKTHGAWDGLDDLETLPDGTKLYTHPADQVAEPVAVAAQMRAAFPLFDDENLSESTHHCEWNILQERKRLHAMLDRLLAKREGVNNEVSS